MKPFPTNRLSLRIKLAASALAGTLSLATGPASAQEVTYIPHPDLTPYQILTADGRCMQASNMPTTQTGWTPTFGPCEYWNNLQKFYVINVASVTDWSSGPARFVLASTLDMNPGGGFSFLGTGSGPSSMSSGTPILDSARNGDQSESGPTWWSVFGSSEPREYRHVATENEVFVITGASRKVMYGTAGTPNVTYRVVPTNPNPTTEHTPVRCDNATFGDPNYGVVKDCWLETVVPTKPVRFLFGEAITKQCMDKSNGGFRIIPCDSRPSGWGLRATGYPVVF